MGNVELFCNELLSGVNIDSFFYDEDHKIFYALVENSHYSPDDGSDPFICAVVGDIIKYLVNTVLALNRELDDYIP